MSELPVASRYSAASLFFLSGTGNTYRVATWLVAQSRQAGLATQVRPLDAPGDLAALPQGETHLLTLLTPAHGFTAPWTMIRFAARLPRGHGSDACVVVTRAGTKFGALFLPGMEGTAGYLLGLILVWRGYRLRGVVGVDMPSNWLALHPGFGEVSARAIIARAQPWALSFYGRVLAGHRAFEAGSWVCLGLGLLLAQVSLMYLIMGRFMLAKLFFATSACNGCGQCAAQCPVRAISLWGQERPRPYWRYGCESCMRCMAYCPRQAIEVGHSWAVAVFWLTSVPVNVYLLNWVAPHTPWAAQLQQPWGVFAVQYPYALLAVALAYGAFTGALRCRAINWLFAHTTLTRWYRRYHAPDVRVEDLRGE